MGLFSKKKKFSKEEKETLEKAREELKKIKENRNDLDVPNEVLYDESKKNIENDREEQKQNEDLAKLNQKEEETILASTGKTYEDSNQTGVCCALDCNILESVMDGKKCKFCNRFCCIEHLLCHKHDCVKDRHVKFVRKLWLRKYGLNVSTGHYCCL